MHVGSVSALWVAARSAALFFWIYLILLVALARWLEPLFRRWVGVLVGHPVLWVPVARRFRIWGLVDSEAVRAADALVALAGALIVLSAALLPAVALGLFAAAR